MKKGTTNIVGRVRQHLEPIVVGLGYDLWDVEYVKEGTNFYLRITIDRAAGIDIQDCEKVHRAIDAPLDELDPISDAYLLEVSSPGIERELKTPAHFNAFMGSRVTMRSFAPLDEAQGQKQLTGTLLSYDENGIGIRVDGTDYLIEKSKIANVRTVDEFNINVEENKQ